LRKLLYSGLVVLFALSLLGGVYAQPTAQVQISNVSVNSGEGVILVTVTVGSSSYQKGLFLITLQTQLLTNNGYVPVNFNSAMLPSGGFVSHVFRVHYHDSGPYLFTANVYALPPMKLLGTATYQLSDPPPAGRD